MRREKKYNYNYLYKTTCTITKRFYYGMHSTDTLDDGYLGSGSELSRSIKKYSKENHVKEILSYYKTRKELKEAEAMLITEEVRQDPMCMNLSLGGYGPNYTGLISVKDKSGNTFSVLKDDPRYLSAEVVPVTKNTVLVKDKNRKYSRVSKDDPKYLSKELLPATTNVAIVKDKNGKQFGVDVDDPRYLSGELISVLSNRVLVKNINNEYFMVLKDDPRYLSGELIPITTGLVSVKDKNGTTFQTSKNDPRYLSGELTPIWKGKKHKEETKKKIGLANSIKQQGKNNSQYGTIWINNGKETKKIKKTNELPKGWYKGRTLK